MPATGVTVVETCSKTPLVPIPGQLSSVSPVPIPGQLCSVLCQGRPCRLLSKGRPCRLRGLVQDGVAIAVHNAGRMKTVSIVVNYAGLSLVSVGDEAACIFNFIAGLGEDYLYCFAFGEGYYRTYPYREALCFVTTMTGIEGSYIDRTLMFIGDMWRLSERVLIVLPRPEDAPSGCQADKARVMLSKAQVTVLVGSDSPRYQAVTWLLDNDCVSEGDVHIMGSPAFKRLIESLPRNRSGMSGRGGGRGRFNSRPSQRRGDSRVPPSRPLYPPPSPIPPGVKSTGTTQAVCTTVSGPVSDSTWTF